MGPLGFLWALPTTLIGLLLAVLGGARPRAICRGGLWQWVGWWGFWGWWYRPGSEWGACTYGYVTIFNPEYADDEEMIHHEAIHTRQARRWGPLFLPVYVLLSVWAWMFGDDPYRDNAFEKEAYGHQDDEDWPI